jgi:hypothetical protein
VAYIHSSLFDRTTRSIELLQKKTQSELLVLAQRHAPNAFEIVEVTDFAVIVDSGVLYIELEYEYFTVDDRRVISTTQFKFE